MTSKIRSIVRVVGDMVVIAISPSHCLHRLLLGRCLLCSMKDLILSLEDMKACALTHASVGVRRVKTTSEDRC